MIAAYVENRTPRIRLFLLLIPDPVLALSTTMTTSPRRPKKANKLVAFDVQTFLDSAGVARKIAEFPRKATIFAQGDPAKTVMYIQVGSVKLTVLNGVGKEAVVAVLGPGDFFGEGDG